jgi:hypothetical protein
VVFFTDMIHSLLTCLYDNNTSFKAVSTWFEIVINYFLLGTFRSCHNAITCGVASSNPAQARCTRYNIM